MNKKLSPLIEQTILLEETINKHGFSRCELEQRYIDVFNKLLSLHELGITRLNRRKRKQ